MRHATTIKVASVVAAMAFTLAACSSSSESESTAPATEAASTAEATASANKELSVAFIQGVIGDNFYISMECGVRAAAQEIGGVNVSVQGGQKWDPALQQPIVTSVMATSPDAILIAPNDITALQRPLEEAAKESKVVLVDTTVEDPSFAVSQIASDNVGGGAAAFEAIKKMVPEGGQVLVIDNQPGISTSDARVEGFEGAVGADPSFEYVGVQYAKNEPAKAAEIVTSTLQRYPDLKAIFATNIFSAEGAATGIKQAGVAGDVRVVGFDAGPAQVEALEDGTVQALIAQQPYQIGYQGVMQAVASLRGESTESTIQTGFTIVTKDNLATEEGQAALYASTC
jgi:ribose transport system substrate-binding protein